MVLRFLQTVPSANPEYPFQAGQIISCPQLSAEMKRWLKAGLVVLLPESLEAAVQPETERAVAVERRR